MKRKLNVAVLIPAHNEESSITTAVFCFANQSYAVGRILVVNDGSTDQTGAVLTRLSAQYPQLITVINNDVPRLKAGAINCGLRALSHASTDIVIIADADTQAAPDLVEQAVKSFQETDSLGGVCSIAGVVDLDPPPSKTSLIRRFERWILWRLQRLEYAGFDAERVGSHKNVFILRGMCTAFNFRVLAGLGGFRERHLIEDYEMTLVLKENGVKTIFNPKMRAYTKVPETLKAILRQRSRWIRGGIDVLLQHGYNRFTRGDIFNHFLFLSLFFAVLFVVGVALLNQGDWQISLSSNPIPIALAIFGYAVSLYKLRYLERIDLADILIRLLILPELVLAVLMSGVQLRAYFLAFTGKKQSW